jgi:dihydrofolate reductase
VFCWLGSGSDVPEPRWYAAQQDSKEKITMGKIVNSTFVSLDGVINHLDRWHFDFVDDESDAFALQQLRDSDALLMGRRTYDVYASVWPGRDGDYADRINAVTKYVASTTLQAPEWANTTVLNGDLAEAVTKVKQAMERTILMHGYGPVAKTLVRHGLLDELVLWVHPVLAGVGTPSDMLISDGLNARLILADVKTLSSGVVILSYRPS